MHGRRASAASGKWRALQQYRLRIAGADGGAYRASAVQRTVMEGGPWAVEDRGVVWKLSEPTTNGRWRLGYADALWRNVARAVQQPDVVPPWGTLDGAECHGDRSAHAGARLSRWSGRGTAGDRFAGAIRPDTRSGRRISDHRAVPWPNRIEANRMDSVCLGIGR